MRYYKVLKPNFLWEVGAIIECVDEHSYASIDEVYDVCEHNEVISKHIVENQPEWFQRVYKVNLATRVVYETRDRAKELLEKTFSE